MAKTEILTIDDNSRSSVESSDLCLSSSLNRPLQCMTSPVNVLRNYRHNPLIGGPGVLLSPTNALIINEDSNPPGLTPCDVNDSASDSGIDDISITENMSPLKRTHEQQKKKNENMYGMAMATTKLVNNVNQNNSNNNNNNSSNNEKNKECDYNNLQISSNKNISKMSTNSKLQENIEITGLKAPLITTTTSMNTIRLPEVGLIKKLSAHDEDEGASMSKRKRSVSFSDSNNPLMTPFLMDLCNDDYHVNDKEYLQENDIENVLNEWTADLI